MKKELLAYNEFEITDCHEYLGYFLHSEAEKEKNKEIDFNVQELRSELRKFFRVTKSQLAEKIRTEKVEEFIDVAKRRVGLIVEKNKLISFGQRCFQEYFAASYISTNCYGINPLWDEIKHKIFKAHWHEVILLLAGILGKHNKKGLDELVDKLLKTNSGKRGLFMAGEMATDKVRMSSSTLFRICDEIVKNLFRSANSPRVVASLDILADLLESEAAEFILSKLRSVGLKNPQRANILRFDIDRQLYIARRKENPRINVLLDAISPRAYDIAS